MRTLRLSLAGTVILALLGGLSGAVLAQEDPMAPAIVTGTVVHGPDPDRGTMTFTDSIMRTEGFQFANTWEASDPRLSGEETYTANKRADGMGGFDVSAATTALVNDAGRWVGTSTSLASATMNAGTFILHGEGGYEGLTAYLVMDATSDDPTFKGAIFPDEMPSFPEVPSE